MTSELFSAPTELICSRDDAPTFDGDDLVRFTQESYRHLLVVHDGPDRRIRLVRAFSVTPNNIEFIV